MADLMGTLFRDMWIKTGTLLDISNKDGSWIFDFAYKSHAGNITVEKRFHLCQWYQPYLFQFPEKEVLVWPSYLIPMSHTNFHLLRPGDAVNLEFDIIGKYIQRLLKGYQ